MLQRPQQSDNAVWASFANLGQLIYCSVGYDRVASSTWSMAATCFWGSIAKDAIEIHTEDQAGTFVLSSSQHMCCCWKCSRTTWIQTGSNRTMSTLLYSSIWFLIVKLLGFSAVDLSNLIRAGFGREVQSFSVIAKHLRHDISFNRIEL
jgi:hypothetical protein